MKSPVANLANAVNWLESELARLESRSKELANELVKTSDLLVREVFNDIDIAVKQVIDEAAKQVDDALKSLEEEYKKRIEEETATVRATAEANLSKAIEAVVSELKRVIAEGV